MTAKFQIEFNIKIKQGVHLFARLINTDTNFYLTDNSYLGEFPIEAFVTMPRALDKDGKPRFDLFTFTLKRPEDRDKIKVNDILELWDDHVEVIESFKLSNDLIIAFLKCYPGKLDGPLELTDDTDKKWTLKRYLVTTGSIETYEKIRNEGKENIFQYQLEPKGHDDSPIKSSKLRIVKPKEKDSSHT